MPTIEVSAANWLSLEESAYHMGLSIRSIRRMIAEGQLHPIRIGKRKLALHYDELEAYLAARSYTPTRRPTCGHTSSKEPHTYDPQPRSL